jgi:hypothetical protein
MWLIIRSSKGHNLNPYRPNPDQEEEEEKEDNTCVWIKDTNLHKKNTINQTWFCIAYTNQEEKEKGKR